MTRLSDFAELVRAPAALTVIGDTLVGAASARGSLGVRALPLASASACLYTAGMALNDYADAELDAVERPERPIPSGRVSRATAFRTGCALTAAGIGLAFTAGRASGVVSLALAGALWTYDLVAKESKAGPVVMAVCRGLDVMMGAAGPGWRRAVLPAALVAAHTLALTAVSRGEVNGTRPAIAGGAAGVTVATAATTALTAGQAAPGALLGAAGYVASALPTQLDAVREPTADRARDATRQGIRSMVPLQAALAARAGSTVATAVLVSVQAVGALLARRKTKGDLT